MLLAFSQRIQFSDPRKQQSRRSSVALSVSFGDLLSKPYHQWLFLVPLLGGISDIYNHPIGNIQVIYSQKKTIDTNKKNQKNSSTTA